MSYLVGNLNCFDKMAHNLGDILFNIFSKKYQIV